MLNRFRTVFYVPWLLKALRARQYETFCVEARQYSTFCLKGAFLRNLAFQSSRMEKHCPKPRAAKTQPETQRLDSDFRGASGTAAQCALGREGLVGQGILPQGRPRVRKQPAPSCNKNARLVERKCMWIGGWCVQHTTPLPNGFQEHSRARPLQDRP